MNIEDDSSLERRYTRARNKVRVQSKKFDKRKKAYLSAMFDIEKKAIKTKLALRLETSTKSKDELRDLTRKAMALKEKYVGQLLKWRSKFILFLELAKQMGYIDKESSYLGNGILSNMEEVTRFSLEKSSYAGSRIIEDRILNIDKLLEKEKIREPVFEDYIPAGNKNEMYETAICEINTTNDNWGYDSDSSETYCETGDKALVSKDNTERKQLPLDWRSHIYAVIKDYQKQKFDELNLRIGERVKQVLPADNSGMAYGVKKFGLIRKKKGFYPMSHVLKDASVEHAQDGRKSRNQFSKRNNPIVRILDAITEPKTKIALLREAAADDGAKVYTEQKKQKKVFTKKNWLKFYGIEISDDEAYTRANEVKKPARIQNAKKISSKKYLFSKSFEHEQRAFNTTEHGDLVLEDFDGAVENCRN